MKSIITLAADDLDCFFNFLLYLEIKVTASNLFACVFVFKTNSYLEKF